MTGTKLYIKNMVCNRCIIVVKQELKKMKLQAIHVSMGEVELVKIATQKQLTEFSYKLEEFGFEMLDNQKQKQIERIKTLLINKVQSGTITEHFSISSHLGKELNKEYSSISRLFSEVEGITIEHYFILQKIEKVKELLIYGEQNLNEITYQLGYSSSAHLSSQFKKTTGLTPTGFKQLGGKRKPLDGV